MADIRTTQKVTGSITYIVDMANRLAKAYPGQTITVSSATGATTGGTLTSASGTGTTCTFHLATAAVPASTNVTVTLTPTLSNGDVDPITVEVGVTA